MIAGPLNLPEGFFDSLRLHARIHPGAEPFYLFSVLLLWENGGENVGGTFLPSPQNRATIFR